MIPYIAILIVLIAAILWQVYSQREYFESSSSVFSLTPITEVSTLQDVYDNQKKVVLKMNEISGLYGSKDFVPKLTDKQAEALGFTVKREATGKYTILSDTSLTVLRKKIKDETEQYTAQLADIDADLKSGKAKLTDKFLTVVAGTKPPSPEMKDMILTQVNLYLDMYTKKINAYMEIYNTAFPPPPPSPAPKLEVVTKTEQITPAVSSEVTITKSKEPVLCSLPAPLLPKDTEDRITKNIVSQVSKEVKKQIDLQRQSQLTLDDILRQTFNIQSSTVDGMTQAYNYKQPTPSPIF